MAELAPRKLPQPSVVPDGSSAQPGISPTEAGILPGGTPGAPVIGGPDTTPKFIVTAADISPGDHGRDNDIDNLRPTRVQASTMETPEGDGGEPQTPSGNPPTAQDTHISATAATHIGAPSGPDLDTGISPIDSDAHEDTADAPAAGQGSGGKMPPRPPTPPEPQDPYPDPSGEPEGEEKGDELTHLEDVPDLIQLSGEVAAALKIDEARARDLENLLAHPILPSLAALSPEQLTDLRYWALSRIFEVDQDKIMRHVGVNDRKRVVAVSKGIRAVERRTDRELMRGSEIVRRVLGPPDDRQETATRLALNDEIDSGGDPFGITPLRGRYEEADIEVAVGRAIVAAINDSGLTTAEKAEKLGQLQIAPVDIARLLLSNGTSITELQTVPGFERASFARDNAHIEVLPAHKGTTREIAYFEPHADAVDPAVELVGVLYGMGWSRAKIERETGMLPDDIDNFITRLEHEERVTTPIHERILADAQAGTEPLRIAEKYGIYNTLVYSFLEYCEAMGQLDRSVIERDRPFETVDTTPTRFDDVKTLAQQGLSNAAIGEALNIPTHHAEVLTRALRMVGELNPIDDTTDISVNGVIVALENGQSARSIAQQQGHRPIDIYYLKALLRARGYLRSIDEPTPAEVRGRYTAVRQLHEAGEIGREIANTLGFPHNRIKLDLETLLWAGEIEPDVNRKAGKDQLRALLRSPYTPDNMVSARLERLGFPILRDFSNPDDPEGVLVRGNKKIQEQFKITAGQMNDPTKAVRYRAFMDRATKLLVKMAIPHKAHMQIQNKRPYRNVYWRRLDHERVMKAFEEARAELTTILLGS